MSKEMTRREAIKHAALWMGGAMLTPTALSLLQGCSSETSKKWDPVFFSETQAALVSITAETIMPADNFAGAIELGVPEFIENMVYKVYPKEDQQTFVKGLDAYGTAAKKTFGKPLPECNKDQQFEFISKQNRLMVKGGQAQPEHVRSFFRDIKDLTLKGYFNTKIGATKVLQYVAVPGYYDGCMPLKEVGTGKTWAV